MDAADTKIPSKSTPNELDLVSMASTSAKDQHSQAFSQSASHSNRGDPRSRAGQGRGGQGGSQRKRDIKRGEWSRNTGDKRAPNEETQRSLKRRRLDGKEEIPTYATRFSAEDIAAEKRKPKRKVAVMIGYSGTGYKGMQLNHQEKTIEGDLFAAFVAAGAISKANADDPKKSSLVRCARTDKGVHAAGNVISLKLVTEDADIVSKINEHLSPQIRVWGIERTNNSFSAYQLCDSRIYEYLIPSYCLLPPHPRSFLGRQIAELAEEEGDRSAYESRQEEVADFWKIAEDEHVNPVIEGIDDSIRDEVLNRFHIHDSPKGDKIEQIESIADYVPSSEAIPVIMSASPNEQVDKYEAPQIRPISKGTSEMEALGDQTPVVEMEEDVDQSPTMETKTRVMSPIDLALRALKSAHATAKRAHRIPPARLARINSVLSRFVGSYRYHNYTIDKSARDPSSIRIIKNFHVSDTPIMIGGTEWLSLKVHGQSFMMHQIRKMVSAAVLIVRCGCHEGRIQDTFLPDRLSIPKAPSLGLLLERPVFDAYNAKLVEFGREKIDFGKYDKEISEFKQREIYERIFRDEEKEGTFLAFFAGLDSTRSAGLLWASSKGLAGTKKEFPKAVAGDPEGVAAAFF